MEWGERKLAEGETEGTGVSPYMDDPVPSKAAKPSSGTTAGSSVRISTSTSSEGLSPVDFTSLTPRPRPIAASMSIASSSSSIDTSDELLLAIRQVRNTVQLTASDINARVAVFLGNGKGWGKPCGSRVRVLTGTGTGQKSRTRQL